MLNQCKSSAFRALTLLVGHQEEHRKILSDEVLAWFSVCTKVQMICMCPADATANPSCLASLKSRLITQVVLEKRPLNGYLSVCRIIWQKSSVCPSIQWCSICCASEFALVLISMTTGQRCNFEDPPRLPQWNNMHLIWPDPVSLIVCLNIRDLTDLTWPSFFLTDCPTRLDATIWPSYSEVKQPLLEPVFYLWLHFYLYIFTCM